MKYVVNLVQTFKAVLGENDEIDNDMEDYRNTDSLIPVGNRSRINFGFNASFTNLQIMLIALVEISSQSQTLAIQFLLLNYFI